MIYYQKNVDITNKLALKVKTIAKLVLYPNSYYQILTILYIAKELNVSYLLLGNGSKVIFLDSIVNKLVIVFDKNYSKIHKMNEFYYVESGATLKNLINFAKKDDYGGIHYLYPIPSSIGGGIINNCGDRNVFLGDFIQCVVFLDNNLNVCVYDNKSCLFSYRDSVFKNSNYVILGALFKLNKISKDIIEKQINKEINYRIKHQEINAFTCGSLFKNNKLYKAYDLILKSFDINTNINGAHLSLKHCNFLINDGNASSIDIINLMMLVKKSVYDKYKIVLESELIFLN